VNRPSLRSSETDPSPPPRLSTSAGGDAAADVRAELNRLAARAAGGDEVAFECLHLGLNDRVTAFFRRRLGRRHDLVEELAQRTWVEVWKSLSLGHFDPERSAFSSYLLGIGSKLFLRHCRTEKRTLNHAPAVQAFLEQMFAMRDTDTPTAESERLIDLCSTLEALRDCLERARNQRRLTVLDVKILDRVLASRSEREIAVDLGIAPSTVNARKQATLAMLRRCLSRKGIR